MSRRTERTEIDFEQAALEYSQRLSTEHFMEGVTQATQRKIFVVAGDLVHVERPDVQSFNELLLQWARRGRRKLGQVVPDNMVVLSDEPIQVESSYDLQHQPAKPFWVLEYVSKKNKRKDYDDSFDKYEKELKVPYYLIYYPDNEELTLYHHDGKKYVTVTPNNHGRYPIPELEMEVGLLDGWARFWFRGELLGIPAELKQEVVEARKERDEARRFSQQLQHDFDKQVQRAEKLQYTLDQERQAREALEREVEQLKAQLSQAKKPPKRP